ncbi:MAG: sensor histidine kinase [Sphingobacterium hotanense]
MINRLGNPNLNFFTVLISIPIFALIFYSLSYILDNFFARKLYVKTVTWILIVYTLVAYLLFAINNGYHGLGSVFGDYLVKNRDFNPILFLQSYLIFIGHFTFLAVLAFQYNSRLRTVVEKNKEMQLRLDEQKLRQEYEYASLAQQIPPHLLVNVFQSWAYQVKNSHPTLAEQMDQMYILIRYIMDSINADSPRKVLLSEEIEIVQRYIKIEESICQTPLNISWHIDGALRHWMVPPTTLLTLMMNVFKHGDIRATDKPVEVLVHSSSDKLKLRIQNALPAIPKRLVSHGMGLHNLARRLEMIFGKRHHFHHGPCMEGFYAEIAINN